METLLNLQYRYKLNRKISDKYKNQQQNLHQPLTNFKQINLSRIIENLRIN